MQRSVIELFADNGLTVMTEVFFPDELMSTLTIHADRDFHINTLEYTRLKAIYDSSQVAWH
ncbi:MAG TPA: GH32 C-terminal domain-containing protein [Flavisolibacter sp.]|nr:GH32 C-terminal domain-containing protein [Flavisolibacter sp.]